MVIKWNNYPEYFWHCCLRLHGKNTEEDTILNDVNIQQIREKIVEPWLQGRPFNIAGTIVSNSSQVAQIRIVQTDKPKRYYKEQYMSEEMARYSPGSFFPPPDSRRLPFEEGTDYTHELLFSESLSAPPKADIALILKICQRIRYTANILGKRSRKDKKPYTIEDEYDVQDLLHGIIRAYVEYSVQEDPIGKVAGTRYSRIDISIEELGILIEVKYARMAEDQQQIFDDFSKDLVLYTKWEPLKDLIYVVYNSNQLRDPEALK